MLSTKAEKLLQALQKRGGGSIDEYFLRDDTGLSHGSIVAGQKPAPVTNPPAPDDSPVTEPAGDPPAKKADTEGTASFLRGDGTYTVYSHEYESEDTYQTKMTEDGFIVN
ncbi:hypothetical protein [Selenomonas ruminantium]|uniref:Uncharacterized protein n=1 Tax=Selenomonas ruminantium TaxID=971 RepID=A0A1H0VN74_SELRU|nr:hypothetical protein [Selenomonas ruminantium]SDP79675.1 hypothetical protein SAMN05216366_1623 [Selenomonas ruminantium]